MWGSAYWGGAEFGTAYWGDGAVTPAPEVTVPARTLGFVVVPGARYRKPVVEEIVEDDEDILVMTAVEAWYF